MMLPACNAACRIALSFILPARCREEGVAGLWTGVGPNIARNAIINAVELASYDTARPLRPGRYEAPCDRSTLQSLRL